MFKSATSVQEVPFHVSVCVLGATDPPVAIAAVTVPLTPKSDLAVFKSATSVQEVPFHVSVSSVFGVIVPPAINPEELEIPAPFPQRPVLD